MFRSVRASQCAYEPRVLPIEGNFWWYKQWHNKDRPLAPKRELRGASCSWRHNTVNYIHSQVSGTYTSVYVSTIIFLQATYYYFAGNQGSLLQVLYWPIGGSKTCILLFQLYIHVFYNVYYIWYPKSCELTHDPWVAGLTSPSALGI